MSFEEQTVVLGAVIWSKWLHFIVTNKNGEKTMLKADDIEASVRSKLQVRRLGCAECLFITEVLQSRRVVLSREDISGQNFAPILEVLPPMKKRKNKEPKKRR